MFRRSSRYALGVSALAVATLAGVSCSSSKHAAPPATRPKLSSTTTAPPTSTTAATIPPTTTVTSTVPNGTTTSIPTTAPRSCFEGSSPALYDPQNGMYATAPKTVNSGAGTLSYDVVQWLVGDKAKAAWVHDHPQEPDGPPNDYYVINVSPRIYTSSFAPDVRVFDIGNEGDPASMRTDTLAGFVARIQSSHDAHGVYNGHIFWVRLGGGKITELCEQWVP